MKTSHQPEIKNLSPLNSKLGKKIVLILILVSGSITLVATMTQLYLEYKHQFNQVELRFNEVKNIHSKLMAQSLWDFDLVLLKQRMDSLVDLPNVDYLSLTTGSYTIDAGQPVTGGKLSDRYSLTYDNAFSGEQEIIGELYIETNTASIYHDLMMEFVTTLSINLLKTLLVCYILLIIFHKSINKRIFAIMDYLSTYRPDTIRRPLELPNPTYISTDSDELAVLGTETNRLTDNLSSLYREISIEKARLSDFTHVSSDWLWETDESLNLVYCSEAMIAELDLDMAIHPSMFELNHFYPNFELISLLNKRQSFKQCEQKVVIDDTTLYLLFQAKARYSDGQFLGYRGTTINITELKTTQLQLEELNKNLEVTVQKRTQDLENSLNQLRQTQSQLIESEKLAALGGLVAGVAHEVNTPLGIAVTATSIVNDVTRELNDAFTHQTLTSVQFTELMEKLQSGGELLDQNLARAAKLVRDFKQTAVDQVSESRDTFLVKSVLESLMSSLHPQTRKVPVTPTIEGDPSLAMNSLPGVLTQIISNLVMNSVTHAFDQQPHPHIQIEFIEQGDQVKVHYRDNGQGIDPSLHQKIFEPFFTSKRGQGGSGLGLNLVFNLLHQKLKGSLEFESTPGNGVHFILSIPKELPEE